MRLLAWLRRQTPSVKKALLTGTLGLLGFASLAAWYAVGLPGATSGGVQLSAPSDADATAALIAERAAQRSAALDPTGSAQVSSAAYVESERLDGLLHLASRYRAHDVTVVLDRVEFYPSHVGAYLTITNESEGDVELDLRSSRFEQTLPSGAALVLQADASGTDAAATLAAGSQLQVPITFPPANGRVPFKVVAADFLAGGLRWRAHFAVDPAEIVDSGSSEPNY